MATKELKRLNMTLNMPCCGFTWPNFDKYTFFQFKNPPTLGTGQHLSGTRAGTIERGKDFLQKKLGGGRRLFSRKQLGGEDFYYYKI